MLLIFWDILANPLPERERKSTAVTNIVSNDTYIHRWTAPATVTGASLVARIKLIFLDDFCYKLRVNFITLNKFVRSIILIHLNQVLQSRSMLSTVSYFILRLEEISEDLGAAVDREALCKLYPYPVLNNLGAVRETFRFYWNMIGKVNNTLGERNLTMSFIGYREETHLGLNSIIQDLDSRPEQNLDVATPVNFLGAIVAGIIGLGAGAITTGAILLNKDSRQIDELNNKIHQTNKNTLLAHERLDILSLNVTKAISSIKITLNEIAHLNKVAEQRFIIRWNLEQLHLSFVELLFDVKHIITVLTLLRKGTISSELVSLSILNKIIAEGERYFNLYFPIQQRNSETLAEVLNLIKVKSLSVSEFIMVIPLAQSKYFDIYSLVSQPLRLRNDVIMIAEISNVILMRESGYVLAKPEQLTKINNSSYLLEATLPEWSLTRDSCELASLQGNLTRILALCPFRKLNHKEGNHMSIVENNRLLFSFEEIDILLECPSERIRERVQGLVVLPSGCDVVTNDAFWSAIKEKEVILEDLLRPRNKSFAIQRLPIFELNETNSDPLHESLLKTIADIPSDRPFTFSFDRYRWPVEAVQSYQVITQGAIILVVIINSICIVCLIFFNYKFWKTQLPSKNTNPRTDNLTKKILGHNLFSPRGSFTRVSKKLKRYSPRKSLRKSVRSLQRSISSRNSSRSNQSRDSRSTSRASSIRSTARRISRKLRQKKSVGRSSSEVSRKSHSRSLSIPRFPMIETKDASNTPTKITKKERSTNTRHSRMYPNLNKLPNPVLQAYK